MAMFKYEEIAQTIEEQIRAGVLKIGQRLPSVRELCKERNVSPSSVFKAYYTLEAKGLIEARNRSGYFVGLHPVLERRTHQQRTIEQEESFYPASRSISEIINSVERAKLLPDKIVLANATPSVKMLPIEKLRKSARDILTRNSERLLKYEDASGMEVLKNFIVIQASKWGGRFLTEDVVITSGCLEAINLCLDMLTQNGDNILVDPLNYFNIRELLSHRSVNVYTFPFNTSDFDATAFEKTISGLNIRLCLICSNFHNPTGISMPDNNKKRLVEIAGVNGVHIIEDDVYGDVYFGAKRPSTLKLYDRHGCVYYCSSFSKSLAPGFRVGYCLTETKAPELARTKRLLSLGTSSLSQAVLADFMRTGRFDLHLKALRKQLHLNLLKYGEAIIRHFPSTVKFNVPAGGFVLWLKFPVSVDGYKFFKEALESNIVVVPGQIFAQNNTHANYIRLSYSAPFDELIEQSLKTLGELAHRSQV